MPWNKTFASTDVMFFRKWCHVELPGFLWGRNVLCEHSTWICTPKDAFHHCLVAPSLFWPERKTHLTAAGSQGYWTDRYNTHRRCIRHHHATSISSILDFVFTHSLPCEWIQLFLLINSIKITTPYRSVVRLSPCLPLLFLFIKYPSNYLQMNIYCSAII